MKKIYIYPYNMGSESAKALAERLECKRIYPDRKYVPGMDHLIVNWGNSTIPKWYQQVYDYPSVTLLNEPALVKEAINKLSTLENLSDHGVPTVEWTTDKEKAKVWNTVYCRHTLTGHSGEGIEVVCPDNEELPSVPLYTKGVQSRYEWRVHVFKDKVIDYARKRIPHNEEADDLIKNRENGWIYVHGLGNNEEDYRPEVAELAIKAIKASYLDFGSVDIIGNRVPRVLEVNTASGVTGRTLEAYAKAIKALAKGDPIPELVTVPERADMDIDELEDGIEEEEYQF